MNFRIAVKYATWWLLAGAVMLLSPAAGQAQLQKEQVMTAIIYNFARFVTWPESSFSAPDDPLIIAVIGDGTLQKELSSLNGKQLEGRPIVIKPLSFKQAAHSNPPFHMLYIPQSSRGSLSRLLQTLARQPVLTISDMPNFVEKGGILCLQEAHSSVGFSINLDSTEQAGLIISSKLFPLATQVIKSGRVKEGP